MAKKKDESKAVPNEDEVRNAVPCPCGAAKLEKCINKQGNPVQYIHQPRWNAYWKEYRTAPEETVSEANAGAALQPMPAIVRHPTKSLKRPSPPKADVPIATLPVSRDDTAARLRFVRSAFDMLVQFEVLKISNTSGLTLPLADIRLQAHSRVLDMITRYMVEENLDIQIVLDGGK